MIKKNLFLNSLLATLTGLYFLHAHYWNIFFSIHELTRCCPHYLYSPQTLILDFLWSLALALPSLVAYLTLGFCLYFFNTTTELPLKPKFLSFLTILNFLIFIGQLGIMLWGILFTGNLFWAW